MSNFRPTDEQQAIIDACIAGKNLVIEAGAGTGKTSTLNLASDQMTGTGLYLAYNKAIQLDAASKFPAHVECRTAHSLAYQAVGKRFRVRLRGPRQLASTVARLLKINQPLRLATDTMLQPTQLARIAVSTVSQFCRTTDQAITARHVPRLDGADDDQHRTIARTVQPYAVAIWNDLQRDDRAGGGQYGFKHDHYVKMYSLTEPTLPYDFILFDEAQDADPVIASLVRRQQQTSQVILVGDTNQAIYGWRGAIDVLQTWDADIRLYLSQSWRFGDAVAGEANKWLHVLGSRLRLRGAPNQASRVEPVQGWPDAVLCRTNGKAMTDAIAAMNNGKRVALVGGGDTIRKLAEAAIELKSGRGTGHPELAMFNNWSEVQDYVDHEDGGSDLKTAVALIDRFGPAETIAAVNRLVDDKPQKGRRFVAPDVVMSTAHKAKGLEWPRVRIASDFHEPTGKDGEPTGIPRPDAMLAYVAVTRARQVLDREGLAWIDNRPELANRL